VWRPPSFRNHCIHYMLLWTIVIFFISPCFVNWIINCACSGPRLRRSRLKLFPTKKVKLIGSQRQYHRNGIFIFCLKSFPHKTISLLRRVMLKVHIEHFTHLISLCQIILHNVTYRPVAKRWLSKQRPLLGNSRNIHTRNMEELYFRCGPCQDIITERYGAKLVVSQFCMGGCEDRTWVHEPEESSLLEAVDREWLVKTQQAGKDLAGALVNCELWRLAVALQLLVLTSCVYKWSVNPFTNPNPAYSHTHTCTWQYVH
jgi:hypothetical protein